ncbi:hypothetical protein GYMLUDRAFT_57694 [Collybiopsis luxurians FD-317 M1]|uniref:Unplaced genomic scaffold GYMLUscaffold_16, whole genome shotgun sequence n=1 Tax=Collybiopsis luxurians FD-317 M1 TaxID=944289 RepID=A0A0D0CKV6_9AGAR|nr:hypothetical protein GYMLUDRAFT_57694 [Collybiopsis luxurians FD-317 M1]
MHKALPEPELEYPNAQPKTSVTCNQGGRDTPPHQAQDSPSSQQWDRHGGANGGGNGPPDGGPPDDNDDNNNHDHGKRGKGPPNLRSPANPVRYRSEDPLADLKEVYEYDSTPRSEEEVLKASFQQYEQLIKFYLFGLPMNSTLAVQKALLQSVPKPGKYGGSMDYSKFDDWAVDLIQWLNIADQCGPPTRYSDMTRTNTLGSFLEGEAQRWFRQEVQCVPDAFAENPDPLAYHWTFMQVMNGLYQQFVHDASISQIADRFHAVVYTQSGGVKSLFNELKRWATCMPIPPDVYTFKQRLLLLIPESMCDHLTRIEKISAERSSVDNIMQAAIECERSIHTGKYYASARYQVTNQPAYQADHRSREVHTEKDADKSRAEAQDGNCQFRACHDCGELGHWKGDPKCKKNKASGNDGPKYTAYQKSNKPKLYWMAEEVSEEGEKLFRLEEVSEPESEPEAEAEPPSGSPDPWGGSQYEPEATDDEYLAPPADTDNERVGFMRDPSDLEYETASEEDELHLDIQEFMRTMSGTEDGGFVATTAPQPKLKRGLTMSHTGHRPAHTRDENWCLSTFIEINGMQAYTLFDSIAHAKVFQLENPITLQLETKGSCTKIVFGANAKYRLNHGDGKHIEGNEYFDVANIDRYDMVVGTVFMQKHGIALDFEKNVIQVQGKPIPTLTEGEDTGEIARRAAKSVSTDFHLKANESVPIKPRPNRAPMAKGWDVMLLDPNDEISIDDIEALMDDVVKGSYSGPEYNKQLHEVSHLVDQFDKEKYG